MTGRQFRLIAGLWLATSILAAAVSHSVGFHEGREAFARETHCPGY